jgi:hypothetical protein
MGTWTLESLTPDIRDRNDVYGNFFAIRFRLKYTRATVGAYQEMPRLQWRETITMIEKNKGTWWQYVGDQYARNPGSMTFTNWVGRYNNAYYAVREQRYRDDDMIRFYDFNGNQLSKDTFPPHVQTAKGRADTVRRYLKDHGGVIEILVVDKPGVNKPDYDKNSDVHKERILTFDCGLNGCNARVKAYQHLAVDGTLRDHQWSRECVRQQITRPFNTTGMTLVTPPADVTIVKPFNGTAAKGEYL